MVLFNIELVLIPFFLIYLQKVLIHFYQEQILVRYFNTILVLQYAQTVQIIIKYVKLGL